MILFANKCSFDLLTHTLSILLTLRRLEVTLTATATFPWATMYRPLAHHGASIWPA
jgi:hypothetical protein